MWICPECNGRGETVYYVETDRDENTVTVEARKGICRTCNGSGKKRQTNGDRFRAKTDEELSLMFYRMCINTESCDECPAVNNCPGVSARRWEEWLKQPAEVE